MSAADQLFAVAIFRGCIDWQIAVRVDFFSPKFGPHFQGAPFGYPFTEEANPKDGPDRDMG